MKRLFVIISVLYSANIVMAQCDTIVFKLEKNRYDQIAQERLESLYKQEKNGAIPFIAPAETNKIYLAAVLTYPTIPEGFCNRISVTGVRKVTTITHDKWSIVCYFDRQGFLNREQRFYKRKLKTDYAYEYKITDSVLVTMITDREDPQNKLVKKSKDYLSPSGKCYKRRVYMSGSESASLYVDNFVYDGDLLISYDVATAWQKRNGKASKVHYYYNKKRQKILETKSFNGTDSVFYSYDKMGRLTGETTTSDSLSVLSGIVPYSDKELNKVQFTYSHFDNKGNWTKSYYTTQEGKIFRSRRKIEYW